MNIVVHGPLPNRISAPMAPMPCCGRWLLDLQPPAIVTSDLEAVTCNVPVGGIAYCGTLDLERVRSEFPANNFELFREAWETPVFIGATHFTFAERADSVVLKPDWHLYGEVYDAMHDAGWRWADLTSGEAYAEIDKMAPVLKGLDAAGYDIVKRDD